MLVSDLFDKWFELIEMFLTSIHLCLAYARPGKIYLTRQSEPEPIQCKFSGMCLGYSDSGHIRVN